MAAFTFSYQDTSGDRNVVGDIVSKVLEARALAEKEREFAQKQAEKYDTSLEEAGIERGYFFKKALGFKFGGEYIGNKKNQLKDILRRKDIAGQIIRGKDGQTKLSKAERFDRIFKLFKDESKKVNFRQQFLELYKGYKDDPMLRPKSDLVPSTEKTTSTAVNKGGSGKRVSKEELLFGLQEIAKSINAIADSVGNSTNEVQQNLIQSNITQSQIADQLKSRNDTIADKLDDIVKAINAQTQFQKQSIDKAENIEAEKRIENIRDVASTEAFDDVMTKEDESKRDNESDRDIEPQSSMIPDAYEQMAGFREKVVQQRLAAGHFETGGIVSGPDSGYLVELHGDELIIPLDNNYTQGEPSAMDGKVRSRPQTPAVKPLKSPTQKYETGTGVGGKVGFGITKQLGIAGGGTTQASKLAQPLVDAMSLPMLAAGGSLIAATSNYISSMGETGKEMAPQLNQAIRPIADVFGVPPVIAQRAKAGTLDEATVTKEEKKKEKDKSMFDVFKDITNNNPGGSLSPISLDGFSQQEISDLGRIVKAEAGISSEGGAHVLNSILNRYRQIKSGRVPPSAWGISGKTAQEVTISDIIRAPDQFQPMRNGSFDAVSEEEGTKALNAAISGGGLDPNKIKENLIKSGKSIEEATGIAVADSFYNPTLSSNKPFPTATAYKTSNKHSFMSTPFGGYTPADLNSLAAVKQEEQEKPSTKDLGQAITNNYGMNVHEKKYFNVPGFDSQVEAYKTTKGFDFYHKGEKINMSSENPDARKVVNYFQQNMSGVSRPDSTQQKTDQASMLRQSPGEGATSIAMLNLPQPEAKPKLNTPPGTAATEALSPSVNPLDGSGMYIG
jgi:hypothetical protein